MFVLFVNKVYKSVLEKKPSSYVFSCATEVNEVSEVTQESTVPV